MKKLRIKLIAWLARDDVAVICNPQLLPEIARESGDKKTLVMGIINEQ